MISVGSSILDSNFAQSKLKQVDGNECIFEKDSWSPYKHKEHGKFVGQPTVVLKFEQLLVVFVRYRDTARLTNTHVSIRPQGSVVTAARSASCPHQQILQHTQCVSQSSLNLSAYMIHLLHKSTLAKKKKWLKWIKCFCCSSHVVWHTVREKEEGGWFPLAPLYGVCLPEIGTMFPTVKSMPFYVTGCVCMFFSTQMLVISILCMCAHCFYASRVSSIDPPQQCV